MSLVWRSSQISGCLVAVNLAESCSAIIIDHRHCPCVAAATLKCLRNSSTQGINSTQYILRKGVHRTIKSEVLLRVPLLSDLVMGLLLSVQK